VRALVAAERPLTQTELASMVAVSQPRVSQVVKMLSEAGAVTSRPSGFVGRRAKLIDLYVARHRPAAAQGDARWYSTRSMSDQAILCRDLARMTNTKVAFSADLAPDLVAPWRHPTLTVVYTSSVLDLGPAGFVPAEGRGDASLLVRVTTDGTLLVPFDPWPRTVDELPITDPVQQVWDLHDLGGEDRREAGDRLRRYILDHAKTATR
jgi:DNA-binding MarR family transcriptional regulator